MRIGQGDRIGWSISAGLVAILCSCQIVGSPAVAHDLPGVLHDYYGAQLPESVKSFNRAYVNERENEVRAVLVNAFIWPVPSRINVCFAKGPVDLRTKIAAAMREWEGLSDGNIVFVFGPLDTTGETKSFAECDGTTRYNVRVGFVPGGGHWSVIGTISDSVFPGNSMNLDFDTDPRPSDQVIREIALHETGHALGFHHEHQSPGAPCTNWAWDKILRNYAWPGNTAEEKEKAMHFNLDRLNDDVLTTGQHAYKYTTYDRTSIMHYSFPAEMFTDGEANRCRVSQPHDLSPLDRQAMKDAYARQAAKGQKTRSINQLLGIARFSAIRDLLDEQKRNYPDR
jgi:hypothetical protein